ncbi:hypothetical protein ACI3EY_02855 [Ornithinimicrobium sp. LYQ92]|uniref:sunset domain-containing protein n=1 Tax=Serinicoccus sp. LYQ92 TaxID=3378798 RepID=UPI00385188AE
MDDTTKWIMVALLLLLIGVAVFLLLRRPGADDETSSIAQDDGALPQATSAGSQGAMTEPTSATDPYDQDRDAGPGHPAPAAGSTEEARYEEQERPVEDGPVAHDPVAHDPNAHDPVVEPVSEERSYDPVVEEPAFQEPVTEERSYDPVVEEPVTQEPAYDPVVDEPAFQEPVTEERSYDPVVEEPAVQEPVSEERSYDPVVDEPVTQQPGYDEPLTADEIGEADEAARREEEYPVGDAGVYRAGEGSEPEPLLTPTPGDAPTEESFAADAPAPEPDPEPEPFAPAQEPTFAESVYGAGSAEPLDDGTGPSGWEVKGNSGSMLFHTPESPSWDGVRAEVWFESEDAARAAGFAHWDRRRR